MELSFTLFCALGIATGVYGLHFIWYCVYTLFGRDIVYDAYVREQLPGVTLALTICVLLNGIVLTADLTGAITIWWPDSPRL